MSNRYEKLLSPIQVGGLLLKNRFCYPNAQPHFLQGPETYPGEGCHTFYANVAKSAAYIVLHDWAYEKQHDHGNNDSMRYPYWNINDPPSSTYMSHMLADMEFNGCYGAINTMLKLPEGYSFSGGPSHFPFETHDPNAKMLPSGMLDEVFDELIERLKVYRMAGFKMFCCDLRSYISPFNNKRTDEYGAQSPENVARLLKRYFGRIKEKMGWDYPISLDFTPVQDNGYDIDFTIAWLKEVEPYVDCLIIKEKTVTDSHCSYYNSRKYRHDCLDYTKRIKAAGIKLPIAVNGGFQDPDEMELYLQQGLCDMFAVVRGFIAEPDYMKKLVEERPEEITPCLRCNKCHGGMSGPWVDYCSVNPLFGMEHRIHKMIPPVERSKKVAIIGGGPAGMKAAVTAAERGHKVTLFEKTGYLGGQLLHAEYFPFKWTLKDYKNFLVDALKRNEVEIRMNTAPTPEEIQREGFDAVIACVGAEPTLPDIQGLKDENGNLNPGFYTIMSLCGNADKLGDDVVVIGGAEVGTEIGMYLAGMGKHVTVLTRQIELVHELRKKHTHDILWVKVDYDLEGRELFTPGWEFYDKFDFITEAKTVAVTPTSVTYLDKDGKEQTIECSNVIISGGMTARREEALSYYGTAKEYYIAGDCTGPEDVLKSVRAAYACAVKL